MQMEKNEKYTILIFNPFQRRTNIFWSGSEKDRATFFGSSKHCLYIRAVDVPSPRRCHTPKDGDDEAPHLECSSLGRPACAPRPDARRTQWGGSSCAPSFEKRARVQSRKALGLILLSHFYSPHTMISSYWELFLQSPAYYLYWGTAIVATGVFLLQILLLLFGFDTDADFSGGDVSFDVDGLSLVSIKTVACFLLGFGWTGVLCYTEITDPVWLAVVALSVGALFMLIVYWLLRQVLHLSQNATFSTSQSVGSVGDVYLRIPAGRGELGKVMVSVAGSLHELAAQSADGSELPTGCKVRVVDAVDDLTVSVQRLA